MTKFTLNIKGGLMFEQRVEVCCGAPPPSRPLIYVGIESSLSVWRTKPATITEDRQRVRHCKFDCTMPQMSSPNPDADRVVFTAIDSTLHQVPDPDPSDTVSWLKRRDKNCPLWNPPDKAFYGRAYLSVGAFEQETVREFNVTLRNKLDSGDTKFSIKLTGQYTRQNWQREKDPNVIAKQLANAPFAGPWDKVSWPPTGDVVAVVTGGAPGMIPGLSSTPSCTNITGVGETKSANLAGFRNKYTQQLEAAVCIHMPGDNSGVIILSHCRVCDAQVHGKVVFVQCEVNNIEARQGGEAHFYGCTGKHALDQCGGTIVVH